MIIIMLGAPGTGKGTVAAILSKKMEISHVSSGDIFRKAISDKTPLGEELNSYMSKGALVPDDLTIRIIEDRLLQDDIKDGVILDGFPRTEAQAIELDRFLKENGKEITMAINLETPEEEIIERIVTRRVCSNPDCKTVYNLIMNPPKTKGICDVCGSEVIQRKDDNEETIKNRLNTYYETFEPIVKFYKGKDILQSFTVSSKINKLGEDVASDILEILKEKK